MAQSSNYKQYERGPRTLTEESGFAGGMLWTGNNIDATHLKAIVNFDYDTTTGYLKTRDPFVTQQNVTIQPSELSSMLTKLAEDNKEFNTQRLIGAYNICALDSTADTYKPAGWLYIFANTERQNGVWTIPYNSIYDNTIIIFRDAEDTYHYIPTPQFNTIVNINLNNCFTLYDNSLYSISNNANWLQVFTLLYDAEHDTYSLHNHNWTTEVKPLIDKTTLLEATTTGWNAARGSDDMYTYGSESGSAWALRGITLYTKDTTPQLLVSPRIGQECTVRINTTYVSTCDYGYIALYVFTDSQTDDGTQGWRHVATKTYSESVDGVYEFDYVFNQKETMLLAVAYGDHTYDTDTPLVDSIDSLTQTYISDTSNNLKLKPYDLSKCIGTCLWNSRMCLWGNQESNNVLYISEVDNFYYYPVPNNIALFDADIISCAPYKDTLLVFTANRIYQLKQTSDGTFTQTVIQNDMPLVRSDAAQLTAIKNMVLFKSGAYFYMLVPKTQSLTGELTIAPIYKNIAGLLNSLDTGVLDVLKLLYPEYLITNCVIDNEGNPVNIYTEQDVIHIMYDVVTTCKSIEKSGNNTQIMHDSYLQYFKLFLNYDTNTRAWTLYIVETTERSLEPAALSAARTMQFIRVVKNNFFEIACQQHTTNLTYYFRCLIDTGYRTLFNSVKKRFREIQIKLYSESENIVKFGTSFLVDGVFRRSYNKLVETQLEDGVFCLAPSFDMNTLITELSMPIKEDGTIDLSNGSDSIELSDWTLDFSHFKRNAPNTIRIPVSGKGYAPRFILMAPIANNIYINDINWVYRLMNGR